MYPLNLKILGAYLYDLVGSTVCTLPPKLFTAVSKNPVCKLSTVAYTSSKFFMLFVTDLNLILLAYFW